MATYTSIYKANINLNIDFNETLSVLSSKSALKWTLNFHYVRSWWRRYLLLCLNTFQHPIKKDINLWENSFERASNQLFQSFAQNLSCPDFLRRINQCSKRSFYWWADILLFFWVTKEGIKFIIQYRLVQRKINRAIFLKGATWNNITTLG